MLSPCAKLEDLALTEIKQENEVIIVNLRYTRMQ